MEFNEKLIQLRKAQGLSQEELGYKLSVSRQTVSKWELGETTPEMNKLIVLSDIFGISLDELVKGAATKSAVEHSYYRASSEFEYKSKLTLWGLPLVHINLGRGLKRAKGIIAIANIATGVVAIGAVSIGLISIGAFSIGLLALGGFALGGFSIGGICLGLIAVGGLAYAYLAVGGCAFGINAMGGCAIAKEIAMGGYAQGVVAVGEQVKGTATIITNTNFSDVDPNQFRMLVSEHLPNAKEWIVNAFANLLG